MATQAERKARRRNVRESQIRARRAKLHPRARQSFRIELFNGGARLVPNNPPLPQPVEEIIAEATRTAKRIDKIAIAFVIIVLLAVMAFGMWKYFHHAVPSNTAESYDAVPLFYSSNRNRHNTKISKATNHSAKMSKSLLTS